DRRRARPQGRPPPHAHVLADARPAPRRGARPEHPPARPEAIQPKGSL
ncbi:MAG: hypothetical protein AVDCRST_MAG79-1914, partial [uncultured Thermoleophilia bacterium]